MTDRPLALVTGGNRGLGLETVRQLVQKGYRVMLGSRDRHKGQEAAAGLSHVEVVDLDVSDAKSIDALGRIATGWGPIDALVNNAGIVGTSPFQTSVIDVPESEVLGVFDVNVLGALRVCRAIVPIMRAQGRGRIVNVSSGMGQLRDMYDGAPAYRLSKTCLNAVTKILAYELRDTKVLVNAVCPGWVKTDLGGPKALLRVEEGASGIVWAATLPDDGPTGGFFRHGKPLPW